MATNPSRAGRVWRGTCCVRAWVVSDCFQRRRRDRLVSRIGANHGRAWRAPRRASTSLRTKSRAPQRPARVSLCRACASIPPPEGLRVIALEPAYRRDLNPATRTTGIGRTHGLNGYDQITHRQMCKAYRTIILTVAANGKSSFSLVPIVVSALR